MCKLVISAFVALAVMCAPLVGQAGEYPSKPVTFLTVFNAGGGSDMVHRLLEKYAKGIMPQPFAITYKTGAGGEFGWTELVSAKADGYFIGGVDLPHITLQPMVRQPGQPGYKTEQFQPIAGLLIDPNCIMVNASSPWKTFAEFLDYAKKNPKKVKAAIVGKLTGDHVFLLNFEQATGTQFNVIPYPGGPKVGPALASNEVDCYFGSISGHFRMENTRCLAVATEQRYPLAMDLPTLKELGVDVISVKSRGIAGPKGMPVTAVAYLEGLIKAINEKPEYIADMKRLGTLPVFQTSQQFAASIKAEQEASGKILRSLGYIK